MTYFIRCDKILNGIIFPRYERGFLMEKQSMTHNLIEYILTLLDLPENSDANFTSLTGREHQSESDINNFNTAHEVIQFMDEMPGGFLIYHADQDEKIIYANKALLRIFDCSSLKDFRELTGNSFKGIVHYEDLEVVEASIREQIAASQYDLDYVEYRIIRKDGAVRWVEDYGHFIHSPSTGDVFYVFISDATEKREQLQQEKAALLNAKQQETEKLQNLIKEYDKEKKLINQEHLRRLEVIEGLSINYDSILYADLDQNKILPYRLSSRTKRQFDYKYQSCEFLWYISDYVKTWVHPDDRERVLNATTPTYIKKKLSSNKTYYINYRILMEGQTKFLQLRIVNVGKKEQISQIVMGYRRIDEEVLQEMEQKQLLEQALSNANLAIVAKNTFLSNMSHDMRTPLNAIFGYCTLAKQQLDDHQLTQYYLSQIETAGRQLLDLINKVLEIAWSESNDTQITESECDLSAIMQELYDALLPDAMEKNIHFSIDCNQLAHPYVYTDPHKLHQLFRYLIGNAIKYTENDGKVCFTVREAENRANKYAVYQFIVQDTGIGIDKDFLSHVFEPFEREKNTTLSGIHGTGLGLTIAKNIATMLGGDIEVNSNVNEGSVFTVTLQLRIQADPLSHTSSTDITNDSFAHLINKRILLVEDNEINLEIETEILQGLGFLIETAVNGSIAVDMVKKSEPGYFSLVLMDIQMPVMDGYQATMAIRQLPDPELSHIPIIALSANAFESDKQMSMESGMNEHLTKPIDIPILLETVSRFIKHTV